MSDTTPSYADLRIEDSWIDYLRTRLPYSFNRIEEKGSGRSRHFVLSEPALLTGVFAADRHNYWKRGNIYYLSGKLLDYHSMSEVFQTYRTLEVVRLLTGSPEPLQHTWPINPFALYNSMQMEKIWGFAQDNTLDRERVVMTNVTLGVCPRNNVLNDMRHWWSVKMLFTPRQSPDCCKQVIAWRVSSPGTNPRTGS